MKEQKSRDDRVYILKFARVPGLPGKAEHVSTSPPEQRGQVLRVIATSRQRREGPQTRDEGLREDVPGGTQLSARVSRTPAQGTRASLPFTSPSTPYGSGQVHNAP